MAQETTTASIPADVTALYEQLKAMLLPEAAKIDYQPRSRAEIRAGLEGALQPSYQAAVDERKQSTQRTNASIDADAAARGIGASSWGTDVKARNYGSEAKDIAAMRSNYGATIANNLNTIMSDQENRKLSADQYNETSRSGALSNALGLALSNYGKWGANADGSGGGDPTPDLTDQYPTMSALQLALKSAANQAEKAGVETYAGQANNAAAQTLYQTQAQLARQAAAQGETGANNPYAWWRPKR